MKATWCSCSLRILPLLPAADDLIMKECASVLNSHLVSELNMYLKIADDIRKANELHTYIKNHMVSSQTSRKGHPQATCNGGLSWQLFTSNDMKPALCTISRTDDGIIVKNKSRYLYIWSGDCINTNTSICYDSVCLLRVDTTFKGSAYQNLPRNIISCPTP